MATAGSDTNTLDYPTAIIIGGAMMARNRFATFQREENYTLMYVPGESENRVFPGEN